jgi:hypothetical protein
VPDAEFQPLSPGIWTWQNYDSSVKADLFSSALQTSSGIWIVDPIPLPEPQLSDLSGTAPIAGIVVTNANHQRSAAVFSDRFSVPIFSHKDAFPDPKPDRWKEVTDASAFDRELQVIEIEGAVAGEIALYHSSGGGTLMVGDAIINFEPYGFTFLPRKYCLNEKQMRNSLRQLLGRPVERLLFAHGTPILSGASPRLRQLLEGDR